MTGSLSVASPPSRASAGRKLPSSLQADSAQASPLAYLDRARESSCVNPATFRQLHFLLTMLAEKGEDETFRFIREVVLTGKEFALT